MVTPRPAGAGDDARALQATARSAKAQQYQPLFLGGRARSGRQAIQRIAKESGSVPTYTTPLDCSRLLRRGGHVGQRGGRDCETRRTRRRHTDELAGDVRRQVHAAPEDDHGLAGGRAAPIHREALVAGNGGCLGAVAPGERRGESEIRRNGPDVRSAGAGEWIRNFSTERSSELL
jgi:hypothetical protein